MPNMESHAMSENATQYHDDPRNATSDQFAIKITGGDGAGCYTWKAQTAIGAPRGRFVDKQEATPYDEWGAYEYNKNPNVPVGTVVWARAFLAVKDVRFMYGMC